MNPVPPSDPGVEMAVHLRRTCEEHDNSLGSHLDHVAHYSCELARLAGLPDERIAEIRYASPLHDIGKVALPPELLNKPGRLTPGEMEVIKSHTSVGHAILDRSPWSVLQCAALIARSHHECWDGSGYPDGLKGGEIPFEARIVAIADVYDALLSRRAYKPAWDQQAVVEEMRRLRGTKFDPALLDLFLVNLPKVAVTAA
jgi:HD-GYP domain-containing protein (c-di-GMP phosphodiesterase class II)